MREMRQIGLEAEVYIAVNHSGIGKFREFGGIWKDLAEFS